jgi:hypothetical protein
MICTFLSRKVKPQEKPSMASTRVGPQLGVGEERMRQPVQVVAVVAAWGVEQSRRQPVEPLRGICSRWGEGVHVEAFATGCVVCGADNLDQAAHGAVALRCRFAASGANRQSEARCVTAEVDRCAFGRTSTVESAQFSSVTDILNT